MIDYFCLFANEVAAQADATIGQYWSAAGNAWDTSRTFPGVSVITPQAIINGISPLTGFWILIATATAVPTLDSHANCVMKLDRDAGAVNGAFVLNAQITGSNRTSLTFKPIPFGSAYPRPLGK